MYAMRAAYTAGILAIATSATRRVGTSTSLIARRACAVARTDAAGRRLMTVRRRMKGRPGGSVDASDLGMSKKRSSPSDRRDVWA